MTNLWEKTLSASGLPECRSIAEHICAGIDNSLSVHIVRNPAFGISQKINLAKGDVQKVSLAKGSVQVIKQSSGKLQKINTFKGVIEYENTLKGKTLK